jgi:hypothetical protein
MIGNMSAISTALPRMSAATRHETVVMGQAGSRSTSERINETMQREEKKIVGGGLQNSSLILAVTVLMAFLWVV